MLSLLLRNLFFTILQPGVVTALVPYLLLRMTGPALLPETWTASNYFGAMLMFAGAVIIVICVLRFATEGKGTLSPLDPTKRLVVRGLYRHTRNPMYVGAMSILVGESIFWWSLPLTIYAAAIFLAFNLVIFLHEEPRLRREFGEEYDDYTRNVSRWI